MFFSFAKIHLFFEMVIKTFLVSLFDPFDYTFILVIYMFVQIFVRDNFSSRRCEIFLVRIFVLYRDVVSSVSGGNFKVVYRHKIDGIPSWSQHPIVKRLMIGCK